MASPDAFCVDGSRSWRRQHRRSSRCRSPMRMHHPVQRRPPGRPCHDALLPPNVKVHLALGYIDMRKGIDGLAMLVQGVLRQDPFTGHLFVFRGRTRANLIKIVLLGWHRVLPVHQAARARRLPVAAERRTPARRCR